MTNPEKNMKKLESVGKLKSQDFWPDYHIKLILLAQNILRLSLFGPYLDPKRSEKLKLLRSVTSQRLSFNILNLNSNPGKKCIHVSKVISGSFTSQRKKYKNFYFGDISPQKMSFLRCFYNISI